MDSTNSISDIIRNPAVATLLGWGVAAICALAVLRYVGLLKSVLVVVLAPMIAVPAIATTTDLTGPGEYFAKLPITHIGLAAVVLITAAWFKRTRF